MMRASWKGAVLAVVASAGVAWGQQSAPPKAVAKAPPTERTVTIQQKDGLPEPCRLLKSWTTADGLSAFLLKSLDTDEMLTVVQKGAEKKGGPKVGVRIYRWGNRTVPPVGAPVPPPDSAVRQVAHTAEQPPRKAGELPHLLPVTAVSDLPPEPIPVTGPAPYSPTSGGVNLTHGPACSSCGCDTAAHAPSCSTCDCDKSHCSYVHHYEKVPSIHFLPGECLPLCPPIHAPNYGYYQTQWHPFGAVTEVPLAGQDAPGLPLASSPAR
jgi:hypothetical protein